MIFIVLKVLWVMYGIMWLYFMYMIYYSKSMMLREKFLALLVFVFPTIWAGVFFLI
jgi:hypothetical protein